MIKATEAKKVPYVVAGAWKFRQFREGGSKFAVTKDELIATATALVNENPGGGNYHDVFIRGTGHHELGICFVYSISTDEKLLDEANNDDLLLIYEDFFRRRHGAAYKGHDIGHDLTRIVLVNDEASSS